MCVYICLNQNLYQLGEYFALQTYPLAIQFDFIVLQRGTIGRAGERGMRGRAGERMCVDNKFKYLDLFQPNLYLMVPICFDLSWGVGDEIWHVVDI